MIVPSIVRFCLLFCCCAVLLAGDVLAHGGVVEEDDVCVIKVNFLRAHFKVYQPERSGFEQYCEDLPAAAESIFVMEYQHDSLSEMAVDFRIIRDVTGKGRFARLEDVEQIADIDSATVFYRPPVIEPDVYTVNHSFAEEGDFVGIVSARHLTTGKLYTAVFPFEVGFTGIGYWPFFIALLLFLQVQYLFMSGRIKKWFGKKATAGALLLCCIFILPEALAAGIKVSFSAPEGQPRINQMHSWILHIEDDAGNPIEGAIVEVDGGMPEHDHGLPTKPRVTADLGDGNYRLDGMRFHMRGSWEITVQVKTENGTSTVIIPLQL